MRNRDREEEKDSKERKKEIEKAKTPDELQLLNIMILSSILLLCIAFHLQATIILKLILLN